MARNPGENGGQLRGAELIPPERQQNSERAPMHNHWSSDQVRPSETYSRAPGPEV